MSIEEELESGIPYKQGKWLAGQLRMLRLREFQRLRLQKWVEWRKKWGNTEGYSPCYFTWEARRRREGG